MSSGDHDDPPTAGEVVLASVRVQLDKLVELEGPSRRDEYDAVHRMRVAARTLRANLRAFDGMIAPGDAAVLGAELHWLGEVLGPVREAEVLHEQLLALLARVPAGLVRGPVAERIDGDLRSEREAAHEAMVEALDSARYSQLLAALKNFAEAPHLVGPADGKPAKVLPDYVDRPRRKLRRRMRLALDMTPGEERYVALHEARKAARQARFAAEAVSPALGKEARRFARRMKRLQDALGEQHDRVVAGDAVVGMADRAFEAGEPTFTYGVMRGSVDCEGRSYDAAVLETWKHVDKARRPGWMD